MLETVKIRRAGFPVRRTFGDFFSRSAKCSSAVNVEMFMYESLFLLAICERIVTRREKWDLPFSLFLRNLVFCRFVCVFICVYVCYHRYKMILKNKLHSDDEKQSCSELLTLHDKAKKDWQLGKTKVEHTRTHTRARAHTHTHKHTHTWSDLFLSLKHDLCSCPGYSQQP